MSRTSSLVLTSFLAVVFAGGCNSDESRTASPAVDSPAFALHKDGTVTVGGHKFFSLSRYHASDLFKTSGGRCGTPEPMFPIEAVPADCSFSSTTILPEYNATVIWEIPVVFHVVSRTDGTGDIPDSLILSQIDVLNEDYRAIAGTLGQNGNDAMIQFALATTDPSGLPTTGIERTTDNSYFNDPGPGAANAMKMALFWDPDRYFNIYTNDGSGGGTLGYATFPQQDAGTYQDGVVLNHVYVGRNAPAASPYDLGRTATHEVGHYLGLFHTFQDGCGSAGAPYTTGDRISDTNPEQGPNFGCPTPGSQPSACSGIDPTENYMDYTDDLCMEQFTVEQINRARCSITNYRPNLYSVIIPNDPPVADFNYAVANLLVTFTDMSTDTDGTIVSWDWSFGDGNTSTLQNPTHTYGAVGSYTVTLTATDDFGSVNTISRQVDTDGPPRADFTWTSTGLTADFTDTSIEPVGAIVSWDWSFGDGSTSTMQNPSHTFAVSTSYVVKQTVTDDDGDTDTATYVVAVGDGPAAGFTYAVNGLDVSFTDASTDPDGAVVGWRWNFGDGSMSLQQNPTHTYASAGSYTVMLEVFDEGALMSNASQVVVVVDPPVAAFSVVVAGTQATFTDMSTDASGTLTTWDWDFGDGNASTDENPVHDYGTGGTFPVSLTVTNDVGTSANVVQDVVINNPPRADFTYAVDGLTVEFTDASGDDDGTITGWAWDFGDGNMSTEQSPTHTYAADGTYTVMLTVADDSSNDATVSMDVSVSAPLGPDAGVPGPDAGTGNPGDGDGGGCGCDVGGAGHSHTPAWPAASLLFGLALVFVRRRIENA